MTTIVRGFGAPIAPTDLQAGDIFVSYGNSGPEIAMLVYWETSPCALLLASAKADFKPHMVYMSALVGQKVKLDCDLLVSPVENGNFVDNITPGQDWPNEGDLILHPTAGPCIVVPGGQGHLKADYRPFSLTEFKSVQRPNDPLYFTQYSLALVWDERNKTVIKAQ